jgi:hypothetical protein
MGWLVGDHGWVVTGVGSERRVKGMGNVGGVAHGGAVL